VSRGGRHRGIVLAVLAVACLYGVTASPAAAEFGPIELVSKSAKEQAGFAREAAISVDGEYVAFVGELGGHTGIFRKDLTSGLLTLVVQGAAEAPSISADGRFVSFATTQALEPAADPTAGTQDVYVADLATPSPTYELVSGVEGHRMPGTSFVSPRVALSADGSEVAFVNEGEVYVRRLAEPGPILISSRREPLTGAMTAEPVTGGGAYAPAGASLSADGNAVAWVGEHLPEQVPLLAAEEQKIRAIEKGSGSENEKTNRYFEPLWRELPLGGQDPPTRRIVGGGDPVAPGCGGSSAEAACRGPFPKLDEDHGERQNLREAEGYGWGTNLPQLSADGSSVAVIGSPEGDNDLFLVDMAPGLSRVQALHQLTRWTNPAPSLVEVESLFDKAEYLVSVGPIKQCAISPDATRIAFTSQRQNFPLNPPTLLTPRPTALPAVTELYQVDLQGQTIERITPGPGTGVSLAPKGEAESARAQRLAEAKYGEAPLGASGPSYSGDDRTIAFASKAFNLVVADANENSDVFTVESKPPSPVEQSTISSRPPSLSVVPLWRLTVHAVSRPNGAVRILAGTPGAGTLQARATSRVGAKARMRQVSSGRRHPPAAGLVQLELTLPPKLRKLARRKGGLYTNLGVQFNGPGGKPLKQNLVARFRVHRKTAAKKGKHG
jgi:hypothetical protein